MKQAFRFALDGKTWGNMPFIIKLGNLSVHTDKKVSKLEQKAIIPKIKEKLSLIQMVTTDEFWFSSDTLLFENI